MITIFSVPKAFDTSFAVIQQNAIRSWMRLTDDIILFGINKKRNRFNASKNIRFYSDIKKNRFGTPILSDVFRKIYATAKYPILAYVNADVILFPDFINSIKKIFFKKYLLISKRRNILLKKEITFNNSYSINLKKTLIRQGRQFPIGNSSEFFVFPKCVKFQMPDFAVGRLYWDSWLIYRAKSMRIPVVDGTKTIYCLHQIHDYSHHKDGKAGIWFGPEAKNNYRLSEGEKTRFKVTDADWITTENDIINPTFTIRRFIRTIRINGIIHPELNIFYFPLYLVLNIIFKSFMLIKIIYKRGIYSVIDSIKHPEEISYKFKEL